MGVARVRGSFVTVGRECGGEFGVEPGLFLTRKGFLGERNVFIFGYLWSVREGNFFLLFWKKLLRFIVPRTRMSDAEEQLQQALALSEQQQVKEQKRILRSIQSSILEDRGTQ